MVSLALAAGAGKTKLASTVVDDMLRALDGQRNDEALAYFYCDRNQMDRQDSPSVLRSFVRQLSTTRTGDAIQPSLVQLYQQKKQTGFASGILDMKECVDLLLQYVNTYPQTTLILDALDECDPRTRKQLIDALDDILARSLKPIKLFISSRPDEDIKYRFETGPNVGIEATDNQDDINKFVTTKIEENDKIRRNKLSNELKEDIVSTLSHKSQGMFQWAFLQIAQLLELPRENDIRLRLGKLPNGLKKAYDEIYENIRHKPGSSLEIAERAFQWVMCSEIPLPPVRLLAAICQDPATDKLNAVDIGIDVVLNACSNLLIVDPQLQVCRFSHLSVQEYLEDHRLKPVKAHNLIARVCLRALSDDNLNRYGLKLSQECQVLERHQDENIDSELSELLEYIRLYWPVHVQRCEEAEDLEQLTTLLMNFLGSMNESERAYRRWHKALTLMDFQKKNNTPAYTAETELKPSSLTSLAICYFGFYRVLWSWWDLSSLNINQCNDDGTPLLTLSALKGFLPICQKLVELGVNVNHRGGTFENALQAASYTGNKKIVELLLAKGADINMQGGRYGNALQAASYWGDKETVELLLAKGADINMQGGVYGNALQAASSRGNKEIVELLLDRGADINWQGGEYSGALQLASFGGNKEIVELLLSKGFDINWQGEEFGNALQAALSGGNKEIVELLLDRGADINWQGGEYGGALQAASRGGNKEIVELLLSKSVDINWQGEEFGNALQAASSRGNKEIVELLLDRGADINMQGGIYGNALNAAAFNGHVTLLQLFIGNHLVDRNAADRQGRTALHLAARGGHLRAVDYLLDLGLEHNARDKKGETALHYAASGASTEVVRSLLYVLQPGGLVQNTNWTPLHWACRTGNSQVIKLLSSKEVESGVVITIDPPSLWTPLSIALFHRNRKLVSEQGKLIHEDNTLQDTVFRPLESETNMDSPQRTKETLSQVQAEWHGFFSSCYGCLHVGLRFVAKNEAS
ncbi:MAG: hypothetical protein M1816_002151 [Peltula sp. TS41687]|nr:MAG: hypothetical protein M1816_002151 [Peltula sp. TS41687]